MEVPLPGTFLPLKPVTTHTGPTYLSFGKSEPTREHNGPAAYNHPAEVKTTNGFSPLRKQASSAGRDNEALASGILKEGTSSASFGSRISRGRDPIPITPHILHYLDRLEPDIGKHARYLTEHLTGQRTLPSSEEELQSLLDRKASREHKRKKGNGGASSGR